MCLLSGFRQGYSIQHALFSVRDTLKKCLDETGLVGTIMMDLSKAYDYIPYDLLIAKLEAYGFMKITLNQRIAHQSATQYGYHRAPF